MLFLQRLLTTAKNKTATTVPRSRASVDAEASGLVKQIRATRSFDPQHAARVAAERLRALGVEVAQ
jgi:hypothetical protein